MMVGRSDATILSPLLESYQISEQKMTSRAFLAKNVPDLSFLQIFLILKSIVKKAENSKESCQ